jgi:hypothetical protein
MLDLTDRRQAGIRELLQRVGEPVVRVALGLL